MTTAAETSPMAAPPIDDRSVEQRIVDSLPLVQYAVSDLTGRLPAHLDRDDLVSAGLLGLAQATRSWDPGRGVTFERYARVRIRGALLDELRSVDWATRSVRAGARLVQAAAERLSTSVGGTASSEQVARELGIPVAQVQRVLAEVDRAKVQHLDALVVDGEAPVTPAADDEPAARLLHRELLGYLRDAVVALPERLRKVVVEYYFDERQMQDIAADLGVTESRVSQMRNEAVTMIRAALAAELDRGDEPRPAAPAQGRAAMRLAAYVAEVASASDYRTRVGSQTASIADRIAATA